MVRRVLLPGKLASRGTFKQNALVNGKATAFEGKPMEDYEYRVIPAPARTVKVKGLKTTGERFAHLLDEYLNEAACEGWEYLRAEALPCEERKGLFGKARSTQVVLIFRRQLPAPAAEGESPHHAEPEYRPESRPAQAEAARSVHPIPSFRAEPALGQGNPAGAEATRREPVLRARPAGDDERGDDRDER